MDAKEEEAPRLKPLEPERLPAPENDRQLPVELPVPREPYPAAEPERKVFLPPKLPEGDEER